jgi:hypothetical protein
MTEHGHFVTKAEVFGSLVAESAREKHRKSIMNNKAHAILHKLIQELALDEIVSDAASNRGGWQGGFPGAGAPLKGLNNKGNNTRVKMRKAPEPELQGVGRGHTANAMKGGLKMVV